MSENPEFDHLLHWVHDVPQAVANYRAAGMPAHTNAVLDGFQNGGWRMDERYLEILTVTDENALRSSRFHDGLRLLRPAIDALGGACGAITFAVNVTDALATAERLRGQGHAVAEFTTVLDEHGVSFVEVFVTDAPSWAPFFITYSPPREEVLASADPDAFETGPHRLTGLVIQTDEPEAAAARLAALLGLPSHGTRIPLPGAEISFERGTRDGIVAATLTGEGPATAEVDGLNFRFGG